MNAKRNKQYFVFIISGSGGKLSDQFKKKQAVSRINYLRIRMQPYRLMQIETGCFPHSLYAAPDAKLQINAN
jgi:hypothetical protein